MSIILRRAAGPKRILAVLTLPLLLASGLVTTTTSAAVAATGYTPGCVTRAEFYGVHRGMPMRKVHRIFDARGHWTARDVEWMSRGYKICGVKGASNVVVTYHWHHGAWRVYSQWANAE